MANTWGNNGNSDIGGGSKITAVEKAMATHSSTVASKIPWTEEPGGLQLKRLQRVGHA